MPENGLEPNAFSRNRVITLRDPLWFGKYRGLCVEAVCRFDPAYLLWVKRTLNLAWQPEALSMAKKAWSKDHFAKLERQNAWAWGFGAGAKVSRDKESIRRIKAEFEERRKAGLGQ